GVVRRPQKIGSSWQNPYFSFTKPTVIEEITEAVKSGSEALEILRGMGLENIAGRSPFTLSMGQARLISILLALAWKPQAILLDEPTNGLSCEWKARVWKTLRNLDTTIVIASHDIEFAFTISDKIIVLDEGKVIGQGSPEDIIEKGYLRTLGLPEPEA
ncbi:MAG: ATP-binding cassette domain-containing protein, partial [Acidilobaceae archaeon]